MNQMHRKRRHRMQRRKWWRKHHRLRYRRGWYRLERSGQDLSLNGDVCDSQVKLAPHFELIALPIVPSATVAFLDFTSAYMAWLQSVHKTLEFKLPIWLSKVVLDPVRTEVKLSTLNSVPVAF